jgi:uncharacterized membrane protein (UPF0127 family)
MNKACALSSLVLATLVGCTSNPTGSGPTPTGQSSVANKTASPTTSESVGQPASSETPVALDPSGGTTGGGQSSKLPEHFERIYQLKDLKVAKVKVNGRTLNLWVMDSNGKRQEGMMWLEKADVKDDQGMIFVFAEEQDQSFWMENTLIGLDIIYVSRAGSVVSIAKGKPKDRTSLPSDGPAMYVIELKQGQAAKYGIKKGTKVQIPPDLKSVD